MSSVVWGGDFTARSADWNFGIDKMRKLDIITNGNYVTQSGCPTSIGVEGSQTFSGGEMGRKHGE